MEQFVVYKNASVEYYDTDRHDTMVTEHYVVRARNKTHAIQLAYEAGFLI